MVYWSRKTIAQNLILSWPVWLGTQTVIALIKKNQFSTAYEIPVCVKTATRPEDQAGVTTTCEKVENPSETEISAVACVSCGQEVAGAGAQWHVDEQSNISETNNIK